VAYSPRFNKANNKEPRAATKAMPLKVFELLSVEDFMIN
jgi:hypothetical protein